MKTHNTYLLEVSIDLDSVLNAVYAQSAWHHAHKPELHRLTSDNARLVTMRVREAFDQIYTQNMAYVGFANFNPNIDQANVRFTFRFNHPYHEAMPRDVAQIIENALAAFALMRLYGSLDDYFKAAWRKYSAQLRMVFARDANFDIINRA
ncbi:MAG: hypothetical protein II592_01945 [Muribaculaceae bacterium]|nr:hypothetical protein [Muribaculaceae bacterium]MBQ4138289.1 hypothetical protein [Muribaculaceae bacterium]